MRMDLPALPPAHEALLSSGLPMRHLQADNTVHAVNQHPMVPTQNG